ncbi:angiogenic factor with G patch and FHA domains 1-like [Rhopilema esculentum]|uniref:angiogenic factor with G patch and FHA domains 1-like n=1 Tax=Rhopilema esculentum TaxID=499914 RepID=UPI0031D5D872|eukprot:gene11939-2510_t
MGSEATELKTNVTPADEDVDMKNLPAVTSPNQSPPIVDPFRKSKTFKGTKDKNEARDNPVKLKRRLELVEKELKDSKLEIKRLNSRLDEADKERQEMAGTVSSMYVQLQYWNAWLGKLSSRFNRQFEKDTESSKELADVDNSTVKNEAPYNNSVPELSLEIAQAKTLSAIEKDELETTKTDTIEEVANNDSVAEILKETAENAFANTGMSYDEKSGLYYDWNTHMYYDPTTHLFYDNDNGIYYYYDNTKGSYVFYSQVNVKQSNGGAASPSTNNDKSEGELSSTESETEPESVPCIRAIVTKSETLKEGSLYLVTCSGVTIGRDKKHVFNVPDKDASKNHAEIKYVEKDSKYFIKDKGSINGTFLNEKRLSDQKKESDWVQINHKDFLKVGNTAFALHVHQKQETCDGCEPGQVQALLIESKPVDYSTSVSTKERDRKKQLKELKNKYLVNGDGLKQALKPMEEGKYTDRANKRRKNIGSEPITNDRPVIATKASVKKMIPSENKGHQMMQKMGWKVGEGLGKQSTGITEPINVVVREKNKGLGTGVTKSVDDNDKAGNFRWKKAKQRYDDIMQNENNASRVQEEVIEDFDF